MAPPFGTHPWDSFPAAWHMLAGVADDVLKSNKNKVRRTNDTSVMTKAEWERLTWPLLLCLLHPPQTLWDERAPGKLMVVKRLAFLATCGCVFCHTNTGKKQCQMFVNSTPYAFNLTFYFVTMKYICRYFRLSCRRVSELCLRVYSV